MFCENCGSEISENWKFCQECGHLNPKYKSVSETKPKKGELAESGRQYENTCQNCGKEIKLGEKLCENCLKEQQRKKKKLIIAIATSILVLVVVAVAGLIAGTTRRGTCGYGVSWEYKLGTLKIYGSGDMDDYVSVNDRPWNEYATKIKKIDLSNGVTSIGDYAFCCFSSIKAVSISTSVNRIGECAFMGCGNIVSINIPESITEINNGTFANCESLESIKIPNGVNSIGMFAFCDCTALKDITIPESVNYISLAAFTDCNNLKNVYIPNGDAIVEDDAFESTTVVTFGNKKTTTDEKSTVELSKTDNISWSYDDGILTISGEGAIRDFEFGEARPWDKYTEDIQKVEISNGITAIGDSVFFKMNFAEISIPQSVTEIGKYALSHCPNLISVNLPTGINTIENGVFCDSGLKSISIPDGVTYIGDYAFYDCISLRKVNIPNSVTYIGKNAFQNCAFKSISIPSNSVKVKEGAFDNDVVFTNDEGFIEIATPEQFNNIRNNLNGNYELVANIEFNAYEDFIPIGQGGFINNIWTSTGGFSGTLNGNGYTVSGINIVSMQQCAGIFSSVTSTGVIKNLNVIATFSCKSYDYNRTLGAIAGYNEGTIVNCNVKSENGSITGMYSMLGGIAGANGGLIQDCYFTGHLDANGEYIQVGGICGLNTIGTIYNCTSDLLGDSSYMYDSIVGSNSYGVIS